MLNRKTIALSLAAVLVSASAAMAASNHHRIHQRTERSVPQGSFAAQQEGFNAYARAQGATGPHYYEPSENGTVWSYYPGYVKSTAGHQ